MYLGSPCYYKTTCHDEKDLLLFRSPPSSWFSDHARLQRRRRLSSAVQPKKPVSIPNSAAVQLLLWQQLAQSPGRRWRHRQLRQSQAVFAQQCPPRCRLGCHQRHTESKKCGDTVQAQNRRRKVSLCCTALYGIVNRALLFVQVCWESC